MTNPSSTLRRAVLRQYNRLLTAYFKDAQRQRALASVDTAAAKATARSQLLAEVTLSLDELDSGIGPQ